MDIVNTPGYIDGAHGPLFVVASMPKSSSVTGAVIILPSLAKEAGHTARALKQLAERLASRGLLAVRIDYACTGESAGDQRHPGATDTWLDSIRSVIGFVGDLGVERVALVGHRAGALLALQDSSVIGGADAMVLWDPVIRGRHFVRAQKALYSVMTATHDEVPANVTARPAEQHVHLVGLTLHDAAAKSLSAMALNADTAGALAGTAALALLRDSERESDLGRMLTEAPSVRVESLGDQTDFLEAANPWVITLPDEVDTIVSWLGEHLTGPAVPVNVDLSPQAAVSTSADGREIVTRVRVLAGDRLVWDTAMAGRHGQAREILVTHSIGHDIRTGPGRLFYELALDIAERGGRVIRFDRAGVGESGIVSTDDTYIQLYKRDYVREGNRIIDAIDPPAGATIAHVGICLGGWMASHAALETHRRRPDSIRSQAVLVNTLRWRLRPARFTGVVERRHRTGFFSAGPDDAASAEPAASSARRLGKLDKKITRLVVGALPKSLYTYLSRTVMARNPDALVGSLRHQGTGVRIVLGPEDYRTFDKWGGPAGFAKRGWKVPLYVTSSGDHVAYHADVQQATKAACLDALDLPEVVVRVEQVPRRIVTTTT
ncbi:hypothetical protein [Gordonia polyisoprenivorans]|uniref:hypothetical protein n=1 Tax=Gordonia polyisoprenivorans TaxID=84595 RepID=UPI001AD7AB86|nr:hypothetical protein [Gordonia polyisoprenivorans]QTI70561.1 hypothetical protein J6U32_08435 [Gordonia polyisoprenivorans]